MAGLELYSWQFCPFAQRARIALALKGAEHATHEIDITRKPYPAEFLALNPSGQVPTIVHDGRVLFESEVVCEYIDEALPGPGLLPDDPYRRGVSRLLIEYGRGTFIPALYRLLLNQDETRDEHLRAQALAAWRWLDGRLAAMGSGGKYLFEEPTLADYAFGPFFQRWQAVEHYRYFEVPGTSDYANVLRWRDGCLLLPQVQDTAPDRDTIIKLYADYARGYAQAATAPGEPSAFDVALSPPASRPMPPRGLRRATEWPGRARSDVHA